MQNALSQGEGLPWQLKEPLAWLLSQSCLLQLHEM
jgi:hypothetical protein